MGQGKIMTIKTVDGKLEVDLGMLARHSMKCRIINTHYNTNNRRINEDPIIKINAKSSTINAIMTWVTYREEIGVDPETGVNIHDMKIPINFELLAEFEKKLFGDMSPDQLRQISLAAGEIGLMELFEMARQEFMTRNIVLRAHVGPTPIIRHIQTQSARYIDITELDPDYPDEEDDWYN